MSDYHKSLIREKGQNNMRQDLLQDTGDIPFSKTLLQLNVRKRTIKENFSHPRSSTQFVAYGSYLAKTGANSIFRNAESLSANWVNKDVNKFTAAIRNLIDTNKFLLKTFNLYIIKQTLTKKYVSLYLIIIAHIFLSLIPRKHHKVVFISEYFYY